MIRWFWLVLLVMLTSGPAMAESAWDLLREPRTVAIMRHALAPGNGDPYGFQLGDCATQRNLDEVGRAQARALGTSIRAAGLVFDRVMTSQWCRCRETADQMSVGPIEELPMLNSFYETRERADEQTTALRAFLATLPEDQAVLLVTHQVNITELTGRWIDSGAMFVLRVDEAGEVEILTEVMTLAAH